MRLPQDHRQIGCVRRRGATNKPPVSSSSPAQHARIRLAAGPASCKRRRCSRHRRHRSSTRTGHTGSASGPRLCPVAWSALASARTSRRRRLDENRSLLHGATSCFNAWKRYCCSCRPPTCWLRQTRYPSGSCPFGKSAKSPSEPACGFQPGDDALLEVVRHPHIVAVERQPNGAGADATDMRRRAIGCAQHATVAEPRSPPRCWRHRKRHRKDLRRRCRCPRSRHQMP